MTTPSRTARLLTTDDLADLVGVKPRTIERWRENRMLAAAGEWTEDLGETGPPFMPFGRTIRYHPAHVQAWMLARERGTTSASRGTPSASRRGTPSKGAPRGR